LTSRCSAGPGGNFSSNYNWKDGIGPRDQRPARLEMAWGTVESNRFGTHEFLDYTQALGIEPYICANLGTGSWSDAQRWVEYCNSAEDTAMTKLRRRNGRANPWKVKYWCLGNEMDGPWQMGHRTAEDYGKFALEAAKLMKWTDPNVQLIAAGASNFGAISTGPAGTAKSLRISRTTPNTSRSTPMSATPPAITTTSSRSRISLTTASRPPPESSAPLPADSATGSLFYIAFDEWNVWYRARGNMQRGRRILEEHYNLEDALVVATMLNTFVNNADTVKIANMARQRHCAHLHERERHVPADDLLPAPVVRRQHARRRA
jgi:alpha-N-arabinofuranosidase